MQPGMQPIRVTGMDGAEAYRMPPDSVVPPFDADNDIMYVKSTDGAGFPTIRAFAFQPIGNPTPQAQRYATRGEFSKAASDAGYAAPMGVPDGHMPCIEAVCPKGYDAVMSQIHAPR